MFCTNSTVTDYIDVVLQQVMKWLESDDIQRLVLVIINKHTGVFENLIVTEKPVERWSFDVKNDGSEMKSDGKFISTKKNEKEINSEIAAIIRQITASVSFLPILDQNDMTFNVLCYTSKNVQPFDKWIDSDGKPIDPNNAQVVGLRSFSTDSHAVGGMVSYLVESE